MKSTYAANAILDHRYGGPAYTKPATVYVGLSTANPGVSGSGLAEPSGGNYSRVAVTNNATEFPGASSGAKSNANAINFPTPSVGWGLVTYAAVFDAASGGNMLDFAALTASKTINSGDTVTIAAGELDLSET